MCVCVCVCVFVCVCVCVCGDLLRRYERPRKSVKSERRRLVMPMLISFLLLVGIFNY